MIPMKSYTKNSALISLNIAHHSTHRNHVTKYTSQVSILHLFDFRDTFLQVLQLGGKGLWQQPGISTPFCQVLSCSVYFVYTGNLVYSARRLSTRAFFRSQISCMRLAILRETKKKTPWQYIQTVEPTTYASCTTVYCCLPIDDCRHQYWLPSVS